ncbi:MAG TPA: hypothetical protein DCY38_03485 [Opitutae bacterium]|jgi:hypothetical protein|nr:hypothetical protein [Opitutae bacterium]
MPLHPSFQECRAYVAAHLHHQTKYHPKQAKRLPAITISRQTGARAHSIGMKLQAALREDAPEGSVPWTLFDENLVKKVLEDHQLPADLEKFMPDDAVNEYEGAVNELLGRHPSLWTLFEKTVSTIVQLSRMGHSIIVGRGGNEITRGFHNVINVRLIGSKEQRIRHLVVTHGMELAYAKKFVKGEDAARRRFLKQHFDADINDPERYDIVINTDHLEDDAVVEMLAAAIRRMG